MVNQYPKTEVINKLCGGEGDSLVKYLLDSSELPAKAGFLGELVLEPGTSVGYHKHVGEGELYYILSGEGEYVEEGKKSIVSSGMATMVYDGGSHSLANTGKTPLVFIAVLIKE